MKKDKDGLDKDYQPDNGSMAANLEEMKNLGKQMEHRRTGKELKEEYGKKPDPIQHEKKDDFLP
ncbi:hypothetical protein D1B31_22620 [Neobacillus notoginsengisoli]|uniref:Multidrug ABC transporter ATPase n=1 Tax=Neobacillus notoginsengisoli TaxID=1578198 RepID=A0A417YEU6_9BACI|nr:hypothetical protein [Neobacillus notoginsengisoli]RHW31183.1 hypothetical protein D1B31_22620 [Neobacillus notoginsengisoli]